MDRSYLEPSCGLYAGLTWVRSLLRVKLRGTLSRRPRAPYEAGFDSRYVQAAWTYLSAGATRA